MAEFEKLRREKKQKHMKQSQQSQHQQNQGYGNSQGNNNMDIEEKNDGQNTHYPGQGHGF